MPNIIYQSVMTALQLLVGCPDNHFKQVHHREKESDKRWAGYCNEASISLLLDFYPPVDERENPWFTLQVAFGVVRHYGPSRRHIAEEGIVFFTALFNHERQKLWYRVDLEAPAGKEFNYESFYVDLLDDPIKYAKELRSFLMTIPSSPSIISRNKWARGADGW